MRVLVHVSVVAAALLCLSAPCFGQCTNDSECKGGRICVNGKCVDPPVRIQPKKIPNCVDNTQCKGNRRCVNGECVEAPAQPPAPIKARCANDSQCKGDLICVNGECVEPAAPEPAPRPSPQPAAQPAPQPAQQPAHLWAPQALPAPKGCSETSQCPQGEACVNGECAPQAEAAPSAERSASVPEVVLPPREKPVRSGGGGFAVGIKPVFGLLVSRGRGDGPDEVERLIKAYGGSIKYKAKAGPVFGIGVDLRLSRLVSVEAGALFSFKGLRVEAESRTTGQASAKLKMTYLEFPVLAKLRLPLNLPLDLSGRAGIVPGINISAKADGTLNGDDREFDLKDSGDSDADVKGGEFCLAVGAEVGYRLGPGSIVVDITYVPGLTSMGTYPDSLDDDPGLLVDETSLGCFYFALGYSLELGKRR